MIWLSLPILGRYMYSYVENINVVNISVHSWFIQAERKSVIKYCTVFSYQSGMPIMTENIPLGDMDMVHFIVGHGILRKDLR